ncbi:hypothetical protein HNV12_06470 [Methanococcoides sp. SA1]|nr:hypothetical protein [Methanococcoides sp. SA1]
MQEINIDEESIEKGNDFEHYIAHLFQEKEGYQIVSWNTDIMRKHSEIKVEADLYPDLKVRHYIEQKEIYIECKYRSRLFKGALEWSKWGQFKRYKEYNEKNKIYVVIGMHGDPNKPDRLYGIPLDDIEYPKLYPKSFEKYEIDADFKYICDNNKSYML